MIRHVFWETIYFQCSTLAYKSTSFRYTGSSTYQANRNLHFNFAVFADFQEVSMQKNFTHRVKLYFLKDSLALFAFNVQMNKVCFVSVNYFAEQNHWSIEMHLIFSSVQ